MHIDWELESKDTEHGLQEHLIVKHLLAIANVIVAKSVEHGENLLKLGILNLVNQVIFILRTKHAWHWCLIRATQLLSIYMPFNLAVNVQYDCL